MATSTITKKALASALKEALREEPYEKISIGDICHRCEMNRKSFYYHFRDKEDLVAWIFRTEFLLPSRASVSEDTWARIEALCRYFYEGKNFWRKILKVEGQNSFSEYLRQYCLGSFRDGTEAADFRAELLSDVFLCALKRWISSPDCLPPERFTEQLRACVYVTAR